MNKNKVNEIIKEFVEAGFKNAGNSILQARKVYQIRVEIYPEFIDIWYGAQDEKIGRFSSPDEALKVALERLWGLNELTTPENIIAWLKNRNAQA